MPTGFGQIAARLVGRPPTIPFLKGRQKKGRTLAKMKLKRWENGGHEIYLKPLSSLQSGGDDPRRVAIKMVEAAATQACRDDEGYSTFLNNDIDIGRSI